MNDVAKMLREKLEKDKAVAASKRAAKPKGKASAPVKKAVAVKGKAAPSNRGAKKVVADKVEAETPR